MLSLLRSIIGSNPASYPEPLPDESTPPETTQVEDGVERRTSCGLSVVGLAKAAAVGIGVTMTGDWLPMAEAKPAPPVNLESPVNAFDHLIKALKPHVVLLPEDHCRDFQGSGNEPIIATALEAGLRTGLEVHAYRETFAAAYPYPYDRNWDFDTDKRDAIATFFDAVRAMCPRDEKEGRRRMRNALRHARLKTASIDLEVPGTVKPFAKALEDRALTFISAGAAHLIYRWIGPDLLASDCSFCPPFPPQDPAFLVEAIGLERQKAVFGIWDEVRDSKRALLVVPLDLFDDASAVREFLHQHAVRGEAVAALDLPARGEIAVVGSVSVKPSLLALARVSPRRNPIKAFCYDDPICVQPDPGAAPPKQPREEL